MRQILTQIVKYDLVIAFLFLVQSPKLVRFRNQLLRTEKKCHVLPYIPICTLILIPHWRCKLHRLQPLPEFLYFLQTFLNLRLPHGCVSCCFFVRNPFLTTHFLLLLIIVPYLTRNCRFYGTLFSTLSQLRPSGNRFSALRVYIKMRLSH